jgi:hypothetical protein
MRFLEQCTADSEAGELVCEDEANGAGADYEDMFLL